MLREIHEFSSHAIRHGLIYKESKEIILSLEQCKLLRVFDAVSMQCLWLVIKETICSQG